MAIALPDDVRALVEAPNYVHLSTLRADGSPRNWVVWIGVETDHLLVCTGESMRLPESFFAAAVNARARPPTWSIRSPSV
jgi:hypothetical protein